MMINFALAVVAFLLCLVLTPLATRLALKLGLVDSPDLERKFHKKPVPRIGGIPIVLSYVGALFLVLTAAKIHNGIHIQHAGLLWILLPAIGIVFATGLIDDLLELKPWQKFLGQIAGASIVALSGTRIHLTGHVTHSFLASEWIEVPLSIIWLVACTNAVNLIDGLDGLASGVGLFATVATLLAGIFTSNTGLVLATMPLVGCLLAFLYYNFTPASIFLGDSGSLTIGFSLGCFSLIWSQQNGNFLNMTAPLIALALPLADVGLAVCRRYLRSVPIFKGDRSHIHHMVLARGFSQRQAALILYGVSAVAASLALLQSFSSFELRGAVLIVFSVLIIAGIRYLDYVELGALSHAFSRRRIMNHVRDEIYLREIDRAMNRALTAEECWSVVVKICTDLRFAEITMLLNDKTFSSSLLEDSNSVWSILLPLGEKGHLKLTRVREEESPSLMMSTLERLQSLLKEKQGIGRAAILVRDCGELSRVISKGSELA